MTKSCAEEAFIQAEKVKKTKERAPFSLDRSAKKLSGKALFFSPSRELSLRLLRKMQPKEKRKEPFIFARVSGKSVPLDLYVRALSLSISKQNALLCNKKRSALEVKEYLRVFKKASLLELAKEEKKRAITPITEQKRPSLERASDSSLIDDVHFFRQAGFGYIDIKINIS